MTLGSKKELSSKLSEELLGILKARFEKNTHRHRGSEWPEIQTRLEKNPGLLWSLHEMERTGGEPDVIVYDRKSDQYIFYDCSEESPKGRRAALVTQCSTSNGRSATRSRNGGRGMGKTLRR